MREETETRAKLRRAARALARLRRVEALLAQNMMLDAAVGAQGAIRRKAAAAFGADVRKDKHVMSRCGNGGCVAAESQKWTLLTADDTLLALR